MTHWALRWRCLGRQRKRVVQAKWTSSTLVRLPTLTFRWWLIRPQTLCHRHRKTLCLSELPRLQPRKHITMLQHWSPFGYYSYKSRKCLCRWLSARLQWWLQCVSNGVNSLRPSGAYMSPDRRQAIILTNDGILLIGPLGINFSEILIEILTFSFKRMRLKVSSAKWRPFCLSLNVTVLMQCCTKPTTSWAHEPLVNWVTCVH